MGSRVCRLIAFWHNREGGRAAPRQISIPRTVATWLTGVPPPGGLDIGPSAHAMGAVANPFKPHRNCRAIVLDGFIA